MMVWLREFWSGTGAMGGLCSFFVSKLWAFFFGRGVFVICIYSLLS